MALHFGKMYWPETYTGGGGYTELEDSAKTRVLIVGGGVSGMLCAYTLTKSGIPAILVEQGKIGAGSTFANTGLIQYSNDKMLSEFAESIGEADAVAFYCACKFAAEQLCGIAEGLRRDVWFKRRSSLFYASTPEDAPALRREHALLHKHGFDAEWWDGERIAAHFPFRRDAAIVTQGDGEINPYLFVRALAEDAAAGGLQIYEHTPLHAAEPANGGFRVRAGRGAIEAEHIVYAVGYAPESAGGRVFPALLNRSYAIATNPLDTLADWHERGLLWETARPYLYMRTTPDNRVIAGGLDEARRQPVLTERDLDRHSQRLLTEVRRLFPALSPEVRYAWCATFGESADGLPWLGEDPDRPGVHYCLGYGGNGIVYSMLGARIIRDRLLGETNPVARIVDPGRPGPSP